MLKNNAVINKIIPIGIIVVCTAVISRFFSEPFLFPVNQDDCLYSALLQDHSIWELMQMLSGKYHGAYIAHFDGRMFSNFYSLLVFSILKTHHSLYYLYDLFMFLVLTFSFLPLLNVLITKQILSPLPLLKKMLLSFLLSSTIYIFLIDGRYEVFYWVSGISNHLLSLIFFIGMLTLFFKGWSFINCLLVAILSFCLGQMNEVYAVVFLAVFLLFSFKIPNSRPLFIVALLFVSLSLYLNLSAHGTAVRFNTLYNISTHFNFVSSLQDTVDTIKLPFINYRYLPIKIPLVALLFLAIRNYFKIRLIVLDNHFLVFNRIVFLLAITSVLLHCYILGEICTYRGLLFYSLCLIYFIFSMAAKNILNPVKLFFR